MAKKTLRDLRLEHGLKQSLVARRIGCSESQYCMMERGSRGISLGNAMKLAEIYGCKVEDISFFSPLGSHSENRGANEIRPNGVI